MEEKKTQERRFLDLECIPEFKIKEVRKEFNEAYLQKAKAILNEILTDPEVRGELRKKILKTVHFLEVDK